jgi:hypothetical protein
MANDEHGILNAGLLVFIFIAAIAFLWMTGSVAGKYLPIEIWLLLIGVTGIASIGLYKKHRV